MCQDFSAFLCHKVNQGVDLKGKKNIEKNQKKQVNG